VQCYHGKNDFLKRASFQKLHTPYPGQEYTYGAWIKVDRQWAKGPAFTHDGSNTLNYASVWWAPHKNLIAMSVTNRGGPQGMQAAQEAINHLIQR
jgi:hypothetical protein